MAYNSTGKGNGKLYAGTVKWDNNFNSGNYAAMLFDSESARNSFFKSHLKLIKSNVISINPERYVDIDDKLEGVENWNYIYYTNDSDISTTQYCCFITNFEYIAPRTTRLYLSPDYFQMLMYKTVFYQSYVERATVKKSADELGAYVQGEPFSVNLVYESKIKDILSAANWLPTWVLHTASFYNTTSKEYEYSGNGSNNTFGEYGFYIDSIPDMNTYLKNYGRKSVEEIAADVGAASGNTKWQDWINAIFAGQAASDVIESVKATTSAADLQDHRNELIGLYAIPTWCRGTGSQATNERKSASESVTLNRSTLANSYTPRNKKMLTSICRAYVLLNQNGLQIALKPEVFNADTTTITLYGIPMSTSGYQYHISNYDDFTASYGEVPYNSERRVGYDQNTGLNKVLNYVGAVSNVVQATGAIAGSAAAHDVLGVANAAGGLVSSGISAVDQIGSKGAYFGNNGDLLRITGEYSRLRFYELNPSVNECRAIDDYFDMYGYTINEIYNISNSARPIYFKGRSNWNYIKVRTLNARCNAPTDWEKAFKSIFESGVTLWHTYEHFADYSQNNN